MNTARAIILLSLLSSANAFAQTDPGSGPAIGTGSNPAPAPVGLSVWGMVPWGGFGAGVRYMMPLSIDPLIKSEGISDRFALEFGADILRYSYSFAYAGGGLDYSWTSVLPVFGMMWNVWLNEKFALYPKLELGYAFGWASGLDSKYGSVSHGGLFLNGAAGVMYRLANGMALRAEAGVAGLKLGVGWLF